MSGLKKRVSNNHRYLGNDAWSCGHIDNADGPCDCGCPEHDHEVKNYYIQCSVSGGVTGHRQSLLKDADGKISVFYSKEEAEEKAKELRAGVSRHTSARFRYVVVSEDMSVGDILANWRRL